MQANATDVLGLSNQSQELLFSGAEANVQSAHPPYPCAEVSPFYG
jgi:hypothetical protein